MKELERRKKTNAGFTLIEIMLVVVIIGMLAAVAGVNINKQGNSAKIKTAKGQMKNFATAADLYQLENGQYPSSLQELVPDYMEDIPTDPWQQEYKYQKSGSSFSLTSNGPDGKTFSYKDK